MANPKNIIEGNEGQLSDEELMSYLYHTASERDKALIEEKIGSDPFEADALEGLCGLIKKDKLEKHVSQLNGKLRKITSKKYRKEKGAIKILQWTVLAILILLFLCVISYVIVSLQNRPIKHSQIKVKTALISRPSM